MQNFLRWLRSSGAVGNAAAIALTLLTSNWGLAVSALIAIVVAVWGTATHLAENHHVQIGVGVFLATLWTIIGVLALVDRTRPRSISLFADYRYGLTLEGFIPNFIPTNATVPEDAGSLGFLIQMRNYSPGPIRYTLESLDIRLGTRAIPKYRSGAVSGYMARGGGKVSRGEGFPPGSLNEFFGAGNTKGSADFAITYGPPDSAPLRRLRVSIDLNISLPRDGIVDSQKGIQITYSDNVITEEDEPIG